MQTRRIESSRNKETTKNVGRDSEKTLTYTYKRKHQSIAKKVKSLATDWSWQREGREHSPQLIFSKKNKKKQTKQERTREIMKYYVVGKLKYIIEGNCTFTIQRVELKVEARLRETLI